MAAGKAGAFGLSCRSRNWQNASESARTACLGSRRVFGKIAAAECAPYVSERERVGCDRAQQAERARRAQRPSCVNGPTVARLCLGLGSASSDLKLGLLRTLQWDIESSRQHFFKKQGRGRNGLAEVDDSMSDGILVFWYCT